MGFIEDSQKIKRSIMYDKFKPSLLYALTDDEPDKEIESQQHISVTPTLLKKILLSDLQWLLNASSYDTHESLSDFSQVKRSVINFGIKSVSGKNISDIEWSDIEKKFIEAIITFEPRIVPHMIEVRCVSSDSLLQTHNLLPVEIKGHIQCEPYPVEFLFRMDLDLESNRFVVKEVG